jgi:hypothetical protein
MRLVFPQLDGGSQLQAENNLVANQPDISVLLPSQSA